MPGATAAFFRTEGEALRTDGMTYAITARGAMRIIVNGKTRAMPCASGDNGQNAIALCLPETACTMHGRRAITEVGPDFAALRDADRSATLFDLGLRSPYFDFYVRTSDRHQILRLREAAGLSLFDTGHGLLSDITAMNLHRVFVSKIGRIEVYQPIAGPEKRIPEGHHTHLLHSLLENRRVFEEGTPILSGWIPCATCHCPGLVHASHPLAYR